MWRKNNPLDKKGASSGTKEPPASPLLSTHYSALCPGPCVINSKVGRWSQDPQLAKHLVLLLWTALLRAQPEHFHTSWQCLQKGQYLLNGFKVRDKKVSVVVGHLILQHRHQSLQAHPCVNTFLRKRFQSSIGFPA